MRRGVTLLLLALAACGGTNSPTTPSRPRLATPGRSQTTSPQHASLFTPDPCTPSTLAERIDFATRSAHLDQSALALLERVANKLRRRPFQRVVLDGDADPTGGTENDRVDLAVRRAQAVKDVLVASGLDGAAIEVSGWWGSLIGNGIDWTDPRALAWKRRLRIHVHPICL